MEDTTLYKKTYIYLVFLKRAHKKKVMNVFVCVSIKTSNNSVTTFHILSPK